MGNALVSHRSTEDYRRITSTTDALLNDTFPESNNDTVTVVSDYPPADICEPLFRTGERLTLVSEEGHWWRVYSRATGRVNYIPRCHVAKVYHGWLFDGIARPKAEELLRLPGNRVGSFMIRSNTRTEGLYILSVRHRSIKHYRISRMPNNWYFISPRLTFQCLEDLVNHYSDTPDGLCCVLTGPCCVLNGPCLTNQDATTTTQTPPAQRHSFDWRAVNSSDLPQRAAAGRQGNRDSGMSFGVQSTLSDYLSLAELQDKQERRRHSWRRHKTRSTVHRVPNYEQLSHNDEDAYERAPQ